MNCFGHVLRYNHREEWPDHRCYLTPKPKSQESIEFLAKISSPMAGPFRKRNDQFFLGNGLSDTRSVWRGGRTTLFALHAGFAARRPSSSKMIGNRSPAARGSSWGSSPRTVEWLLPGPAAASSRRESPTMSASKRPRFALEAARPRPKPWRALHWSDARPTSWRAPPVSVRERIRQPLRQSEQTDRQCTCRGRWRACRSRR